MLLNASPESIDLTGWKISDRLKKTHPLSGVINPGATFVVTLPQDVQLGNKGGDHYPPKRQGLEGGRRFVYGSTGAERGLDRRVLADSGHCS